MSDGGVDNFKIRNQIDCRERGKEKSMEANLIRETVGTGKYPDVRYVVC